MESNKVNYVWGLLRITMGLTFLWAFFDKVFGLGFATKPADAWLAGGSPTTGFLQFGVHGPFAGFFHSIAGSGLVAWLFMLGLLFVGITLTFGIFVKLGSMAGFAMLFLMYLALGLPPVNHPFIDDHFFEMLIMIGLFVSNSGNYLGLGKSWTQTGLVRNTKIFQ